MRGLQTGMLAAGTGVALGVWGCRTEEEGSLEDFFAEESFSSGGGVGTVEEGAGNVRRWGEGSHDLFPL